MHTLELLPGFNRLFHSHDGSIGTNRADEESVRSLPGIRMGKGDIAGSIPPGSCGLASAVEDAFLKVKIHLPIIQRGRKPVRRAGMDIEECNRNPAAYDADIGLQADSF